MATINFINETKRPVEAVSLKKAKFPAQALSVPLDVVSTGTSSEIEALPKKKWTVLCYEQGNNNLSSMVAQGIPDLEAVGSNDDMNIVAQVSTPYPVTAENINAKRFYIIKDGREELASLGSVDMGSEPVLEDFMKWGIKKFPAEHYLVILHDHGDQWLGGMRDEAYGHMLTTPQIGEAIQKTKEETGKNIDVVAFNACFMGGQEVAHEIKDSADYMVGSEELSFGSFFGGGPAPLAEILTDLANANKRGIMAPRDFAMKWVEECSHNWGTPTQSAFDLSKAGAVSQASSDLAKVLIETDTPVEILRQDADKCQQYSIPDPGEPFNHIHDLYDFAQTLIKDERIKDKSVKENAEKVIKLISEEIIAEEHDPKGKQANSHGVSIFIPTDKNSVEHAFEEYQQDVDFQPDPAMKNVYGDLKFAKDTLWDEFFKKIAS